jgi:predicted FMN-binding regulatory protein PaiB
VFAQVPLWSFVAVEAMGRARVQALNHIALKRVDFVLVHPGSRQVQQVLQVQEASPRPHQAERQRVIEAVLDAARIKLVKLRPEPSYTVPLLASLLGLAPED